MAEVAVPYTCRQNQVVIPDRYFHPICGVGNDVPLLFVYGRYFAQNNGRIPLVAENLADRRADLPWTKDGGRHLVEQRLKQVVIGTVN